jgi:hypothetical protein
MKNFINERIVKPLLVPLVTADPTPVVLFTSFTALWWVIIYLIGCNGPACGVTVPMAQHASNVFWISVFTLCGFGNLIAKSLGNVRLQRGVMLFSVGIWAFVSALLFKSIPFSFPAGTYALLTLLTSWAYWRLGNG